MHAHVHYLRLHKHRRTMQAYTHAYTCPQVNVDSLKDLQLDWPIGGDAGERAQALQVEAQPCSAQGVDTHTHTHTHTRTHTHKDTYKRKHTHARTHTHSLSFTCTRMQARKHTHTHTHALACL